MATPFLGELRLLSFDFAPRHWAECNGQTLPIAQNRELAELLGTKYGGDGKTTFGLPDLRGRAPIGVGSSFPRQGEKLGEEFHTLTEKEIPRHKHTVMASSRPGSQAAPAFPAATANVYRIADQLTSLHPETLATVGGGERHENRHPLLVVTWCIALKGIFPSKP